MSIPTLQSFAAGDTDYIVKMNQNNVAIEAAFTDDDGRITTLEAGTLGGAADAVANIENLCVNGDFLMGFCGADTKANAALITVINTNHHAAGIECVKYADGWFVYQDQADALAVESVDLNGVSAPGPWGYLHVLPGVAAGSPYTGTIFQRLDNYYDLTSMKGKTLQFSVLYTAATDNEFYLEVDDGVAQTQSSNALTGSNSQINVTHTINAAATKLTLKIVCIKDAVVAPNALKIHYAHARLGVNTPNLIGLTPPPMSSDEIIKCQLTSVNLEIINLNVAASIDLAGAVETYQNIYALRVPLLFTSDSDLVLTTIIPASGGDPRDVGALAVPPQFSLLQQHVWGPNCPRSPAAATMFTYEAVLLSITRTIPPDVAPFPANGFLSNGVMKYYVRHIPNI